LLQFIKEYVSLLLWDKKFPWVLFYERMKMKKFALLGLALLATGCASLEKTSTDLTTKWIGKSYDEFVMELGVAKANQKLQNGTTMYLWEESVKIYDSSPVCKLNILVNSNNLIQKIQAAGSLEACYKIFYLSNRL